MSFAIKSNIVTKTIIIVTIIAAILIFGSFSTLADNQIGLGVITGGIVNVRSGPGTSNQVVGQVTLGQEYIINDYDNDWYKIDINGISGWVVGDYIKVLRGTITGDVVNVRSGPGTSSPVIGQVTRGQVLKVFGYENDWYKVDYEGGFIVSDYVSLNTESGDNEREDILASRSGDQRLTDKRDAVVAEAKKYLGRPYVYGGNGPSSFDCSGFTKYVYAQMGYSINRTAAAQYSNGASVSSSELELGDLVFFGGRSGGGIGHVGMYIGGGQFIHAATTRTGVTVSSMSQDYYKTRFVGARRLIR